MATITIERVQQIVHEATRNGGTVYVPSPRHQLETNHGYGGLDSDPDNETGLINVLHSAAEYWLNGEPGRALEEEVGRIENWIAREARLWAIEHSS